MRIPIHQVDAFTARRFAGNPAAVCLLEQWLPDATLQAIAAENNLAETAFVRRLGDAHFDLRWFTPAIEVDLCGHATLASAFVLRRVGLAKGDELRFATRASAHCTLVPYWASRLGRDTLQARQVSPRGGELRCRLVGDRVRMAGHCAPYLVGEIEV